MFKTTHDSDSFYFLDTSGYTRNQNTSFLWAIKKSQQSMRWPGKRNFFLKCCFQLNSNQPKHRFFFLPSEISEVNNNTQREMKHEKEDNCNNYGFRLDKNRSQQPLCEEICQWSRLPEIFYVLLKVSLNTHSGNMSLYNYRGQIIHFLKNIPLLPWKRVR